MKRALLVLSILALAGCGKIDEGKLDGVWKLNHIEGNGRSVGAFRMRDKKIEPYVSGRGFACSTPYRLDGKKLIIEGSSATDCRVMSRELEIDKLDDSVLVLKLEDVKFHYDRSTEEQVRGEDRNRSRFGESSTVDLFEIR